MLVPTSSFPGDSGFQLISNDGKGCNLFKESHIIIQNQTDCKLLFAWGNLHIYNIYIYIITTMRIIGKTCYMIWKGSVGEVTWKK